MKGPGKVPRIDRRVSRTNGAPNRRKWDETMPIRAYEFAVSGMTNAQVAKSLGVSPMIFSKWIERKPVLADALRRAREPRQNIDSLMAALRSRMSKKVLRLWDTLTDWQNEPNAIVKIEKLLQEKGTKARQLLFVNAMYAFSFNVNEACRFVNIRRTTFNNWVMTEPGFAELFDEVQEAVKDMCVSNLLKASNAGDVSATIFACKTLARDRGFAEKLEVEHTHKGSLAIEELNLNPKVLRELKKALADQRADKGADYGRGLTEKKLKRLTVADDTLPDDEEIIDAEFEKKDEDDEDE